MSVVAKIIQEGSRDPHYPSWGYGHLCRISSGPREGRLVRIFSANTLAVGTKLSAERLSGRLQTVEIIKE